MSDTLERLEANRLAEAREANLEMTHVLLADPALTGADRARVLRYHLEALAGLRRWESFEAADTESAQLLEQGVDPIAAADLWTIRGMAQELRGKWADAQQRYQAGIDGLPPEHPEQRAQLLAGVGRTHLVLGNHDASLEAFVEAERLQRTFGIPATSEVLRGLCTFYLYGNNWRLAPESDQQRALRWCERDLDLSQDRPKRRMAAINNLVVALRLAEQNDRADALLEAEYWSEAHRQDPNFGLGANYLVLLDRRGEFQTALTVLETLGALATQQGSPLQRAFVLRRSGNMLDKLERYPEALEAYESAYALYAEHPDATQSLNALYDLLRAQIRVDKSPEVVLATFDTYYERYNEHNGAEARRRLETLQAEYELERKELELQTLSLSQQVQAQELANAKAAQRSTRNVAGLLLLGLLLLSMAVVLLVMNLRLRKRASVHLAEKNAEIEALNRELHRKSHEDPLTGLSNRRSLDERVKSFTEAQGRRSTDSTGPHGFIVFLIDLDHFKSINDQHGHAAGDAVLRHFAAVLRRCAREGDVQARWGGEEFCWICPNLDFDGAKAVCQRLLRAVHDAVFECAGETLEVTCSVGYTTWIPQPSSPGRWERAASLADIALYEAKAGGRDRGVGLEAPLAVTADDSEAGLRKQLADGAMRREVVRP